MKIVDLGAGPPLVLVPGIQVRWEWMRPSVDALSRRCRVITFSLADEPTCGGHFDESTGFSCYVRQIGDAMDAAGVQRAAICGVSYGGLIAAAFATRHPDRVSALVLVSAVPPSWRPDGRVNFYLKAPRLLTPLFCLASLRMYREIAAANGRLPTSLVASARHGLNVLAHPFSPVRMARRVRLLASVDLLDELRRLTVQTLVVTGEDGLDLVVAPSRTREYLQMWPHARGVVIARTGHIGLITRADEFARVVGSFVDAADDVDKRRRVG